MVWDPWIPEYSRSFRLVLLYIYFNTAKIRLQSLAQKGTIDTRIDHELGRNMDQKMRQWFPPVIFTIHQDLDQVHQISGCETSSFQRWFLPIKNQSSKVDDTSQTFFRNALLITLEKLSLLSRRFTCRLIELSFTYFKRIIWIDAVHVCEIWRRHLQRYVDDRGEVLLIFHLI